MALTQTTDKDFHDLVAKNERVIVKYFADWCGSCKLFAPKYKRLSNDERYDEIIFLDVNAEENPHARKAAGVNNLPFFAIFRNGVLLETIATSKEDKVAELLEKLV